MKKQKNSQIQENDENPFASSSGDLMAGLMFIFVLLLSAMMLQVQVIDSTKLSIRFQEPSTLFDFSKARLKNEFKVILDDFFPRYLALISSEKYRENIEEIRIEGHTDSQGSYETNMELSQDRTRAVLNYCLAMIGDNQLKEWATYRITANGLSYSHLIYNADGTENPDLSRRVEFRIRTNAEQQLEKIAKERK